MEYYIQQKRCTDVWPINTNFISIFITMIVILVYQSSENEFIKIIFGLLLISTFYFVNIEISFYLMMFIMVSNEYLNIGGTSLSIIFISIFVCRNIFGNIQQLKINIKLIIIALLLFVISLIMSLFFNSTEQLTTTIKCFAYLFYMNAILNNRDNSQLRLFVNGSIFLALGINYAGVISLLINGIPSFTTRYAFTGEITINSQGILCALAIVNLLFSVVVLKIKTLLYHSILIIGCFVWGLLTQSRSFFLTILIGVVLITFFNQSFKRSVYFLIFILLAVSIIFIFYFTNQEFYFLLNKAINRITNPINNDISNGRYYLWQQTINSMTADTRYKLFGAGDYMTINASFNNMVMVAHNMFLEVWVIYGYIGCALLALLHILYIKVCVFKFFKIQRLPFISFVPLIVMICVLFFSHHFIGRSMSMLFILNLLPLNQQMLKEIKKETDFHANTFYDS